MITKSPHHKPAWTEAAISSGTLRRHAPKITPCLQAGYRSAGVAAQAQEARMKWQMHIIMDLSGSLASRLPSVKPQLLSVIRKGFASTSQVSSLAPLMDCVQCSLWTYKGILYHDCKTALLFIFPI